MNKSYQNLLDEVTLLRDQLQESSEARVKLLAERDQAVVELAELKAKFNSLQQAAHDLSESMSQEESDAAMEVIDRLECHTASRYMQKLRAKHWREAAEYVGPDCDRHSDADIVLRNKADAIGRGDA